ncbi:AGAP007060-PA-like protein [Anopheles sinensis]|uniref:AGAP007060-PA-like protein n=1 Tax=Anopheles sinensis TaxID=74873 RepID=A0A084WJS5_ANOSI|nr:AGAP007060-PA-like protein [Anopheles sinensis]
MGRVNLSLRLAFCVLLATCFASNVHECDDNDCRFKLQLAEIDENWNSTKFLLTAESGLVTVELYGSALSTIPPSLFADNGHKINELLASSSGVQTVYVDTFAQAYALEKLDFDRNNIKELPSYMFVNATNLTSIRIRSNQLRDVGEFTFQGLINLENLQLGHNHIRKLPPKLFAGLRRLSSLGIFQNRLAELEDDLFADLRELKDLDLSYNKIETLSNNLFVGTPQLQELDLRDNRIADVENGTFSLPKLTKLDLSQNRLKHLPKELFRKTVSLEHLLLRNNLIEQLNPDLFKTLYRLKKLQLEHNKLQMLDAAIFKTLRNLGHLSLENNQLRHIESGTFDTLSNLQELDLSHNRLTSIDRGIFWKLKYVDRLDLSDNNIKTLKPGSLDGMSFLRELYLPGNKLRTIDGGVFCGNHELRTLSLQRNKLTYVTPEALNCLAITDLDLSKNHLQSLLISVSTLEKLDLSNNRFRNLSDDAFSNLTNLDALTMDNNYLEAIPKTVSALPTLVWLSLKNNKINSTSVESGLQSIESLELTNNLITRVELDQYHNLRNVFLDQNYIEDFPENALANNKYLQTLNLAQNRLTGPLEYRFKHNEELDDLRLDGNPLGLITNKSFVGLGRFVRKLSLKNTNLTDLGTNSFATNSSFNELNLSENYISKIGDNDFNGVKNIYRLYLEDNRVDIQDVRSLPDGVRNVFISANSCVVPDTLLRNKTKLHMLRIGGADFSTLSAGFFSDTIELTVLHITNNKQLRKLTSHFFKDATQIEILVLSNNSLSTLEPKVFDPLTELYQVDISRNPLVKLDKELFNNTRKLTKLILHNANLTNLPLGIFDSLEELATLDLGNNQLSSLPNGIFRKQYSLETLSLQLNSIEQLDPAVFDGLSQLKTLYLGHNKLRTIHPQLLSNVVLESLDLSYNKFVSFDLTATGFQNTLGILNLNGNGLTSLKISPALRLLEVANNQLSSIEVNQTEESPSNLVQLSAERNRFTNFSSFLQFKAMKFLDASFNDFSELDVGSISSQLQLLEGLNVSDSHVQRIKSDGINEQEALTSLDISNNYLTSLELDEFEKFSYLQRFVLGGNRFDTFSISDLLAAFPDLESIGLEGTQWKCEFLRTLEASMKESFTEFFFKPEGKVIQLNCI